MALFAPIRNEYKLLDGVPVVVLENGNVIERHLRKSHVNVGEILESARELHGIERLDQIKYAVLERSWTISIIPYERE